MISKLKCQSASIWHVLTEAPLPGQCTSGRFLFAAVPGFWFSSLVRISLKGSLQEIACSGRLIVHEERWDQD